jgi:hypothetical protein
MTRYCSQFYQFCDKVVRPCKETSSPFRMYLAVEIKATLSNFRWIWDEIRKISWFGIYIIEVIHL